MRLLPLFAAGIASILIACGVSSGRVIWRDWQGVAKVEMAREAAQALILILKAATAISAERGPTNRALGSDAPVHEALVKARLATDQSLSSASAAASPLPSSRPQGLGPVFRQATASLGAARASLDSELAKPLVKRDSQEMEKAVLAMIASVPTLDAAIADVSEIALNANAHWLSMLHSIVIATELRDVAGQVGSIFTIGLIEERSFNAEELVRYERLNGRIDQMLKEMAQFTSHLNGAGHRAQLPEAMLESYIRQGREQAAQIVAKSHRNELFLQTPGEFASSYVPAMASLVAFRDRVGELLVAEIERHGAELRRSLILDLIVFSALLALVTSLLIGMRARILTPLSAIAAALERISQGKLETIDPLPKRRDEIGAVAYAVEQMRALILEKRATDAERTAQEQAHVAQSRAARTALAAELEAIVGTAVSAMMADIGTFSSEAAELTQLAQAARDHVATAMRHTGEANVNVQAVSSSAHTLGVNVDEVAWLASNSQILAEDVKDLGRKSGDIVAFLSDSSMRIHDIVALIGNVAKQTNLLALNATIEAARAGSAGKGFAVVATEVKMLAAQTAAATGQIDRQIVEIAQAAEKASSAIEAMRNGVDGIGEAVTQVAQAVEEQSIATRGIVASAQGARSGSERVVEHVAGVEALVGKTDEAARRLAEAARRLDRQASAVETNVRTLVAEMIAA